MKFKFYSFDIFDTCITRMHAYPRDLFLDLGVQLAPKDVSEPATRRYAKRFQRARIRAEKLAHWIARRHGHAHADIDAIYRQFHWFMKPPVALEELVRQELELEEESLYPIPEMIACIEQLRAEGKRIVFVSDMYIPAKLLGPMLLRKGVMRSNEKLYVSCDMASSKHDGGLFDVVMAQEGVVASDVLHTGDNAHADIRMAQKCGLQTQHFTAAHLLQSEARIAGANIPRHQAASWQAAFSRRCRLMAQQRLNADSVNQLDGVLFSVITPFLLAYVQWLLDDARKRGIQRLYFVARDGEVLLKIARELKPKGIELRYLYGSRRAWLSPSIVSDMGDWERVLAVAGNSNTPYDIATRIGLNEEKMFEVRKTLLMTEEEWNFNLDLDAARAFIRRLMGDAQFISLVLKSAQTKRGAALAYFKQEGLLEGKAWALVDAGWSLNSQAALKRILSTATQSVVHLQGYYVGLARDFLDQKSAGSAYAFCEPAGGIFSRRRVVVEHCFLPALHASTRGYVDDGNALAPDFSVDFRGTHEIEYANRLHAIGTVVARLVEESPDLAIAIRTYAEQIKSHAAAFVCNPGSDVAHCYSSMTAVADMRQEHAYSQHLCQPLGWTSVWATALMALSPKKAFKTPAWMWLEGSMAISPWYISLPLACMLKLDALRNRLFT